MRSIKLLRHTLLLFALFFISTSESGAQTSDTTHQQRQFTISLQPSYSRQQAYISLQHLEASYGWSRHKNRMFEVGMDNVSATTQNFYWYGNRRYEDPAKLVRRSLGLNAAQYYFLGAVEARLQPYMAVGLASLLSYYNNTPGTFSDGSQISYPLKSITWTNRLLLSPGIQYNFSTLRVKLEIPITLVEAESRYAKIENPAIPIHNQQQSTFVPTYFPFDIIALEVGVGYRISR